MKMHLTVISVLVITLMTLACSSKKKENSSAKPTDKCNKPLQLQEDSASSETNRSETLSENADQPSNESNANGQNNGTLPSDSSSDPSSSTNTSYDPDCPPTTPISGGSENGFGTPNENDDNQSEELSPPTEGSQKKWTSGDGLLACEEQGLSWMAVVNQGPAECGPKLADFCCTKQNVLTLFSSYGAQLTNAIESKENSGKKLYHCSQENGSTQLHFAKANDQGGADYGKITIPSIATNPPGRTDCQQITMADLGFSEPDSSDSGSQSGDESTSNNSIPLTNSGILKWLKDKNYSDWHVIDRLENSAHHGPIKKYFNKTLETSLRDGNTRHPVGSAVIREVYKSDKQTLDGYGALIKIKDGTDASSWQFYEISGAPDFNDAPINKAGQNSCASCHQAGTDYIRETNF